MDALRSASVASRKQKREHDHELPSLDLAAQNDQAFLSVQPPNLKLFRSACGTGKLTSGP